MASETMSETEDLESNPKNTENERSVICVTCLSINRVLHPVAALRHLVPLLNDVGLDVSDSICWECRAIMNKFHKFKNQARKSISTLNSLVGKNINETHNQVCNLSTLKRSTKNYFDAQFTFHIKEENIESGQNHQYSVDIEPWNVKKEVFSSPSVQQETVPVEYPKNHQLFITLLPLQVPSTGSKLTVPGSPLEREREINSQLPSTSVKISISEDDSESDDEKHDDNNEDVDDEAMRRTKSNKIKKQSNTFSNTDFFTKILTEDEMLKCREEEKERIGFKMANFRCMSCIKYFASIEGLTKHNLLHCSTTQKGKFTCSICDLRFMNQEAVSIHQQTHYLTYHCSYCSYSSYSQQRLISHWQGNHNPSAKRECTDCGMEFRTLRHLRYHKKTVHCEKAHRVKCVECGKTLASTSSLNRHILMHKGTIPEVECDICHKKCRGSWGLRAHKRTHDESHGEDAYCAECDIQFKNIHLYRAHLKSNSKHVDRDSFKFQCSHCGKKFYCNTYLTNHIQAVHLKLKDKECEHCNQTFHNLEQLQRHKREKHSGKVKARNHICHHCGKAFCAKNKLNEHMNTHLGKRPFKCAECGATFAHSASLYTHNRLLHLKLKRGKKNNAATVEQS